MPDKIRVLFVDDELKILHGLRRKLYTMKHKWDMTFVNSGAQALETLGASQEPYDVVVTDMRMPGMNGVQLLEAVKERYPHTIRIVLTGQADKDAALRAVGLAHQFISKPCNTETLKASLEQARVLYDLLTSPDLKRLIAQIDSLPSLPSLYYELMAELQAPNASIRKSGEIITQDIAMVAKILQLVNSAFFGLSRHIADPVQGVLLLGLDTVKALVLSVHIFSQFNQIGSKVISPKSLQQHSMTVAMLARQIAEAEGATEPQLVDYAFTAGLLHDLGKLLLAAKLPQKYEAAFQLATQAGIELSKAELEIFGATHAEVGAYLLGLWGLPSPIIEAVAFHHNPQASLAQKFNPLTAVHVADVLAGEANLLDSHKKLDQIDAVYLDDLGLTERLPVWQAFCQELVKEQTL